MPPYHIIRVLVSWVRAFDWFIRGWHVLVVGRVGANEEHVVSIVGEPETCKEMQWLVSYRCTGYSTIIHMWPHWSKTTQEVLEVSLKVSPDCPQIADYHLWGHVLQNGGRLSLELHARESQIHRHTESSRVSVKVAHGVTTKVMTVYLNLTF